jgi:drug/metabolite transporter (DMT)-like permease
VRAKGSGGAGASFRLGLRAAPRALAWAVSVILLKPALEEVDAVRSQAIRLPLAAAMLWVTPWAWSVQRPLREQGRAGLWRLGALGALSAASSILFVAGVRHAGVAVATVLSSTAPIFALPLGFFLLGERVAPIAVAGIILTIIGSPSSALAERAHLLRCASTGSTYRKYASPAAASGIALAGLSGRLPVFQKLRHDRDPLLEWRVLSRR